MVVEYSVFGGGPTRAQAIEEAKKWIASERDAWWNKQEAIIFLDDLRLVPSRLMYLKFLRAHTTDSRITLVVVTTASATPGILAPTIPTPVGYGFLL